MGSSESRTMFHGTRPEAAKSIQKEGFKPSTNGMLGPGVYVSQDINKARKHGAVVLETEVRTGKVKKIDRQGHSMQKSWANEGYDSVCSVQRESGTREQRVRDRKYSRSATLMIPAGGNTLR